MLKKTLISVALIASMCLTLCSCRDKYGHYFFEKKEGDDYVAGLNSYEENSSEAEVSSQIDPEKASYTVKYENSQGKKTVTTESGRIIVCEIDVNIPVFKISSPDIDCTKSERAVNEYFGLLAREYELEGDNLGKDALEEQQKASENNSYFAPFEYSITYQITKCTKIISAAFVNYQYLGGVHGSTFIEGHTLSAVTGEELKLDDIVKNKEAFYEYSAEYVRQVLDGGEYNPDDGYETKLLDVLKEAPWYLTNDGLVFVINEYIIAPYSEGAYQITIPYSEAADYFVDGLVK
ncbi:MAG: DUF3298 and DUF4163 domain-containing protein [Clostridia bacterium]|nr:DUF3298 and DUF4163 domain-containing protein [Clostridia bacterium]